MKELREDGHEYHHDDYIKSDLTFDEDGFIYESTKESEVMGKWEGPLMERCAEIVNHNNGDILEIGFGMGIFATKAYSLGVSSYTIVEIHPQVLERLYEWAKDKPEVIIIEGDWIENLDKIKSRKYDGIYFDTHMDDGRPKFRKLVVDECIKEDGVFGYYTMSDYDTYKYGEDLQQESVTLYPGKNAWFQNATEITLLASFVKHPLKLNI